MENGPNVVIVMARCSHNKGYFGVRFEENKVGDQGLPFRLHLNPKRLWVADWAFAIESEVGRKEGYDKSEIRGTISMGITYPGCPHCNGRSIFRCSCRKVACWDGKSQMVTCPYCGMTGLVNGQIDRLSSGGDR